MALSKATSKRIAAVRLHEMLAHIDNVLFYDIFDRGANNLLHQTGANLDEFLVANAALESILLYLHEEYKLDELGIDRIEPEAMEQYVLFHEMREKLNNESRQS